ncbi:MAG: glycoside hydrolase family 16 protein [Solirubrobacterales bacterium]|nr:glycoside hydrolase family 16 protein [Solirubrobacterales bacterium]
MTRLKTKRLAPGAIAIAAVFAAVVALAAAVAVSVAPTGKWRRVFFDDFTHGLRSSHWGVYSGQPGGDPGGWWSPAHAVVAHGVLNLETYRDPRYGWRWVSAGISSAPALTQTYGKYEVRVRVDRGKGVSFVALLWPSGNTWPPEIDFAENGGGTTARDHITATLHYGSDNAQIARTLPIDLTRWHTVGVEWLPGKLIYTIDGRQWALVWSDAVPDQRMEMDLQTQAGTCGDSYAPCPDAQTPAHVNAQIQWVAAYAYQGR